MFNARPMSRLLIAASKEQLQPVIRELYRRNIFHIEDFVDQKEEAYEGFKIGMPLSGAASVSSEVLRVRSVASSAGIDAASIEPAARVPAGTLRSRIDNELPGIEKEIQSLNAEKTKLDTTLREYGQKIHDLEPFAAAPLPMELYRGYERFYVFAGHIPADVALSVPHEKFFTDKVPGNFLVAIVPLEAKDDVERTLLDARFQAVAIPEETGHPADRIAWYTTEITRLTAEIDKLSGRLAAQKEAHSAFLVACDELLTAEVEQTEVPLRFATTDEAFVAEGWVPSEDVPGLIEALRQATGGKIFVSETEIDYDRDAVPVEYDNPSFSRPTEVLMDVYARPRYREIDPTLMVSLVFPVFFGLILGDVGYGLVLLAMSIGLRKIMKGDAAGRLFDTLRNASISSIFFGILYSEFLGFALPWSPVIFSRHLQIGGHGGGHGPQVAELMIMSVWIGILHITLGRILGMANARRLYHGSHATKVMMANAGWLATMWGLLFIVWSFFALPLMPDMTAFPVIAAGFNATAVLGAVFVVAGVVAIARENVLEVVELPTILSHLLSYARIVAVGLSSVAIAMVVNFIAIGMLIEPQLETLSPLGVIIIIAGLVVFLLGHVLNTGLGLLGGGLHSIRLHYVEFFTKFYKGGGLKYHPFGMKRRFTED
ncbi:MAG: V-type ATP synthase subunit I [Methanomicrobiales archaeon]|nr:V-type ATP synthase subunit I [Methanomicrobiales archaeon]